MKYKDLIYKITSSNKFEQPNMKKKVSNINKAKASVQTKDILIGVLSSDNFKLIEKNASIIKRELERTLTVLFNSPISESFSFLPYSKNILEMMVEIFPDRNFYYISEREEFKEVKKLKQDKLNIKMIYASLNKKRDFVDKIDYLVTINKEIEPTMQTILKKKNVMVFPMFFQETGNSSQKEKLVTPDPSGWVYNSANGMWIKNWGNDGSQQIPSWQAPDDWNLDPNPAP